MISSRALLGLVATLTPINLFQASSQVINPVTGLRGACLELCLACISLLCFLLGIVNLSNDTYSPRAILDEYFRASGGQHGTVSLSNLALVRLRSLLAFPLCRFLRVRCELGVELPETDDDDDDEVAVVS